jgi:starch synthase (maltosyl-transferring)
VTETAIKAIGKPRFLIEDIYPRIDAGRFAVKRTAGAPVDVWCDILRDGHDQLGADLLWRRRGSAQWRREPMSLYSNDRWFGRFTPPEAGPYEYAIEAWTDEFGSWRHGVLLKRGAGQDIGAELQEGWVLLNGLEPEAAGDFNAEIDTLLSDELAARATRRPGADASRTEPMPLYADRARAIAGAWYEIMPRSQGREPGRHGTFQDCIERLPDIAGLGFDVLYLTPIHPIGRAYRKGRNNSLVAEPGDPGSPYAIGGPEGGHDAIHPELGTLDDFTRLVHACHEHGMEVALDFATQCSPDHPWVRDHPDWFKRRLDGTIRHAENPPKKYEDIVNPDFYGAEAAAVWTALRDVVLFWVDQGVRIFRVDNPHTKPFPFWEWLIRETQDKAPETIFLSEAFTRPKLMKALAKLGFTQSYTYFTWRTGKTELEDYMTELTRHPERDFYRPNFFVNTPDILPFHLQKGERWMFQSRVALAALLSGNYGVYSGFELLEHEPVPGKEEYLDSEKYEIKVRDWQRTPNIRDYIARLNRIRRDNPALLQTANFRLLPIEDGEAIAFLKEAPEAQNAVLGVVSLTGAGPRSVWLHLAGAEIGPASERRPLRTLQNCVTGEALHPEWGGVRLWIDPAYDPALIFRCIA